jgi:valyl-tRNA synthetase
VKKLQRIELWSFGKKKYLNKVGTSERTKAVIEPRLSDQWFLKMEDLVKPAIQSVLVDEIKLHPKRFDTYAHWLNNIRDWNISRQWWGQQIPLFLRRWQRGFCGC